MSRAWIVALLALAGCPQVASYECREQADCLGGACVPAPDGRLLCAAPSAACGGGLAFGESAGDLAGTCVGGDDGGPDAPGASAGARIAWASTGAVDVRDVGTGPDGLVVTPLPPLGDAAQKYRAVAWVDLDRDGARELVVTTADGNTGGDEQLVVRARAGGWDVVKDLRTIGAPNYEGFDVAAGDYDRDGRTDLIVAGSYPIAVLFRGTPSAAVLVAGAEVPAPLSEGLGSSVAIADVDGDGGDEVMVLNYYNPTAAHVLRWNPTSRALEEVSGLRVPVDGGSFRGALGDVDGDGDLDLALAEGPRVRVRKNLGGSFGAPTDPDLWTFAPTGGANDLSEVAWFDADGDGRLDLVTAHGGSDGGPVQIFLNTGGDLEDGWAWQSEDRESVSRIATGDVDGDGDADLAIASAHTPNRIYRNAGAARFEVGWTAPAIVPTFGVAITPR